MKINFGSKPDKHVHHNCTDCGKIAITQCHECLDWICVECSRKNNGRCSACFCEENYPERDELWLKE